MVGCFKQLNFGSEGQALAKNSVCCSVENKDNGFSQGYQYLLLIFALVFEEKICVKRCVQWGNIMSESVIGSRDKYVLQY